MNNNKSEITNESRLSKIKNYPSLFNKKMKKLVLKPLQYIQNDTGRTKHYTPAAQEWFNSIYTFNVNSTKTIPTADKTLINLLKSYFNFNIKLKKFYKIRELPTRYKRLSAKRIFMGKGDLKHTNEKVIITFYLYNIERIVLFSKLRDICRVLFAPTENIEKRENKNRYGKTIVTYNRPFTLNEYLALTNHYEKWYFSYVLHFVNKLNKQYKKMIKLCETLKSLVEKNLLNNDEKKIIFNKLNINIISYPNFNIYLKKCRNKYRKAYYRLVYWLWLSNIKFSTKFIEKLTRLVMFIYKKKVEFNIVNLKKMHLNSDIFTQLVSLKLRNRNNKLYKVLKASLRKLNIENVRKPRRQKRDKNLYLLNKIRNKNISSMFTEHNQNSLDNLLLGYFPWKNNLKVKRTKFSTITEEYYIGLDRYIINSLKHKEIAGVKVEAKGRLTRRLTASRSVFKMRRKGGIKNVDSSFKGLSAIILRGHVKSNVQYSILNSNNKNGAFGVKGWVSSK